MPLLHYATAAAAAAARSPPLPPQLSMDPGLKGCQYLLGKLPTWISLTEREKMEVRGGGGSWRDVVCRDVMN